MQQNQRTIYFILQTASKLEIRHTVKRVPLVCPQTGFRELEIPVGGRNSHVPDFRRESLACRRRSFVTAHRNAIIDRIRTERRVQSSTHLTDGPGVRLLGGGLGGGPPVPQVGVGVHELIDKTLRSGRLLQDFLQVVLPQ